MVAWLPITASEDFSSLIPSPFLFLQYNLSQYFIKSLVSIYIIMTLPALFTIEPTKSTVIKFSFLKNFFASLVFFEYLRPALPLTCFNSYINLPPCLPRMSICLSLMLVPFLPDPLCAPCFLGEYPSIVFSERLYERWILEILHA